MTTSRRALVIAAASPGELAGPEPADVVIAADSGVDVAHELGLAVDLVVGDLDSISAAGLRRVREQGVPVVEHPPDKDATDLELALGLAVARAETVTVLVGGGGRFDHVLANTAVLASPRWASTFLDAWVGRTHVVVVRGTRRLEGEVGDVVTLLPVGGPARGVRSVGLAFPLDGETLDATSGRGVSNVIERVPASVEVADGVLLAISPPRPSTDPFAARG